MGSDLGCCANLVRASLIIINIVFGILGIIVFSIGIWAIVAEADYSFITGSNIASGAALLIVSGIITFIICVVGILGAIFKLRPLLVVYALIVLIIVILEIVAGIVAFVFRDTLTGELEERFIDAIDRYRFAEDNTERDDDVNQAIDSIQRVFDCCGFNNAYDWFVINPQAVRDADGLPGCPVCTVGPNDPNCMTFRNDTVVPNGRFNTTIDGCGNITSTAFTAFAYAVGGVGIAFGILEIVGILFALFLCCCITSARKQEVV